MSDFVPFATYQHGTPSNGYGDFGSGFNGFPFLIGNGEIWDNSTFYNDDGVLRPSNSSSAQTDVAGPGTPFPIGFSLQEFFAIYWRTKILSIEITATKPGGTASDTFTLSAAAARPGAYWSIEHSGDDLFEIERREREERDLTYNLNHGMYFQLDHAPFGDVVSSRSPNVPSDAQPGYASGELNDFCVFSGDTGFRQTIAIGNAFKVGDLYYAAISIFLFQGLLDTFDDALISSEQHGGGLEGPPKYDTCGSISWGDKEIALYGPDGSSVSGTLSVAKYWPYKNSAGNPVWDTDTGAIIASVS
jgi:hypothetical protein